MSTWSNASTSLSSKSNGARAWPLADHFTHFHRWVCVCGALDSTSRKQKFMEMTESLGGLHWPGNGEIDDAVTATKIGRRM